MKLTVLGSGTLIPDDRRRSAAHWLEGTGFRLLMDCGSGTVHGFQRHGLDWTRLTHLALTHFHTDHVGDIPGLLWAFTHALPEPRTSPLIVLGPPGVRAFFSRTAEAFGAFVLDPGFPVEVVELGRRDRWSDPQGRFDLETHPTVHTDASVAFKVRAADRVVSYTGDTGPEAGLFRFLSRSDVIVAECSHPDPPNLDTHLTPSGIAALGRTAVPGKIVTTHAYPPLDPAEVPDRVREVGYDGIVIAGSDGLTIDLSTEEGA